MLLNAPFLVKITLRVYTQQNNSKPLRLRVYVSSKEFIHLTVTYYVGGDTIQSGDYVFTSSEIWNVFTLTMHRKGTRGYIPQKEYTAYCG